MAFKARLARRSVGRIWSNTWLHYWRLLDQTISLLILRTSVLYTTPGAIVSAIYVAVRQWLRNTHIPMFHLQRSSRVTEMCIAKQETMDWIMSRLINYEKTDTCYQAAPYSKIVSVLLLSRNAHFARNWAHPARNLLGGSSRLSEAGDCVCTTCTFEKLS